MGGISDKGFQVTLGSRHLEETDVETGKVMWAIREIWPMLKEKGEGWGLHSWDSHPLVRNSRVSCYGEGRHHLGDVEMFIGGHLL